MIKLDNLRPHPLISLGLNPDSNIFGTPCQMEQGANYLLLAPSGKGKSTILHILYGLRKDFDGEVILDGDSVKGLSPNDISKIRQSKLSIVFQDLRLFPNLTSLENIKLNTVWPDSATVEEIREMAQRLGILELLDQKAETLSYGQRQRVAIIRALAKPFSYLLLDEPFSHLDEVNTNLACQLITEKARTNKAGIILASLGEKFAFEYDRELAI
ncbi:MAG: ATP-binding cassette domain-containing protein [Saprospiraceae bacterium]|nr:ATP-binding cassette domain-containing protein [Saprospiraceae bacterium]